MVLRAATSTTGYYCVWELLLLPDDFQNGARRVPVAIQSAFGQFRAVLFPPAEFWHDSHIREQVVVLDEQTLLAAGLFGYQEPIMGCRILGQADKSPAISSCGSRFMAVAWSRTAFCSFSKARCASGPTRRSSSEASRFLMSKVATRIEVAVSFWTATRSMARRDLTPGEGA